MSASVGDTHTSRQGAPFEDAPPHDSEVETRDISEDSIDRHRGELHELVKRIQRYIARTGVLPVLQEHPELTFDEAFERLHGRRRRSRYLNNLVESLHEVHRSVQAATSMREPVIGMIIDLQEIFELYNWTLAFYAKFREHEAPAEAIFDAVLGRTSVHTEEHDSYVRRELYGCISDISSVITRLRNLGAVLAKERPAAVQAGVYGDSGGGSLAEITMRLIERGVKPLIAGLVLRGFKPVAKNIKGARRKNILRMRFSELIKAVEKQSDRTAAAIAMRSQPN